MVIKKHIVSISEREWMKEWDSLERSAGFKTILSLSDRNVRVYRSAIPPAHLATITIPERGKRGFCIEWGDDVKAKEQSEIIHALTDNGWRYGDCD